MRSQLSHAVFWKEFKPRQQTERYTNDHVKEISQGKYSGVSFRGSHAKLRLNHVIVKEVKEWVCKRLDEFQKVR